MVDLIVWVHSICLLLLSWEVKKHGKQGKNTKIAKWFSNREVKIIRNQNPAGTRKLKLFLSRYQHFFPLTANQNSRCFAKE